MRAFFSESCKVSQLEGVVMTFLLLVGVTDSTYSFGCAALRPVLESKIVIVDGSGPFRVRRIAT